MSELREPTDEFLQKGQFERTYEDDEVSEEDVLRNRLCNLQQTCRHQASLLKEISEIMDLHTATGMLSNSEARKIKKIVEPYTKHN